MKTVQTMKNLVITLMTLLPFLGFSQNPATEMEYDEPKMYIESGVAPFSELYWERPATEVPTKDKMTVKNDPKNEPSQIAKNEFTTQRYYDNPKVYFELGEETYAKQTKSAKTALPVYSEDNYKLHRSINPNAQNVSEKIDSESFITVRIYDSPKVYYDIKVPTGTENKFFAIHNQPR